MKSFNPSPNRIEIYLIPKGIYTNYFYQIAPYRINPSQDVVEYTRVFSLCDINAAVQGQIIIQIGIQKPVGRAKELDVPNPT
jgi:hypothetical protein